MLKELLETGRVWIVATLRADFYELLLKQATLKELKESGASLDLGPPGAVELAEMVRAPAAAAGLVFETLPVKGALDDRLLADAKTAESCRSFNSPCASFTNSERKPMARRA